MTGSNSPPKPMRLSPAQVRALLSIYRGRPWSHLYGRSMHGAAGQTARSLRKLGLITRDDELTEAGRYEAASRS